jgi:phage-related protein
MVDTLKRIFWEGASKADLLAFPRDAKKSVGYQLHRLQGGNTPKDWKALNKLGRGIAGVYEIRVWAGDGAYRAAYVTKFGSCITVLHCWQKDTQVTADRDKALIVTRYRNAKKRFEK